MYAKGELPLQGALGRGGLQRANRELLNLPCRVTPEPQLEGLLAAGQLEVSGVLAIAVQPTTEPTWSRPGGGDLAINFVWLQFTGEQLVEWFMG